MQKVATSHCLRIMKMLEKFKQPCWFCNTTWSGGDKYEVVGHDGQFVVDKKLCTHMSCGRWQLSGVPCGYAISKKSQKITCIIVIGSAHSWKHIRTY